MIDTYLDGLEVYLVGGAVRDELIGLPAGDKDWVVIGASPAIMVGRGFIPVGDDFPVFLHPKTHEEYALARTERKSGKGYKGFTFYAGKDVSLEQDLGRRDLTINAIAKDSNGNIIDPLNGCADIKAKMLRHIGNAFTEDPVRLLRLARFTAKFSDFEIASQTAALCHDLVASGELDALVPERIWQEFAKGLMTNCPARMLNVLQDFGALSKIAKNLVWHKKNSVILNQANLQGLDIAQRYALMCAWSRDQIMLLAPKICTTMAVLLPKVVAQLKIIRHDFASDLINTKPELNRFESYLKIYELTDAFRKPDRFISLMQTADLLIDIGGISIWQRKLDALRKIDAGAIAKQAGGNVALIKHNLKQARLQVLSDIY